MPLKKSPPKPLPINKTRLLLKPAPDALPPNSEETEAAALACVLLAGEQQSQAEVEALLLQLRPALFYDLRHQTIHAACVQLRMEQHAVDVVTVNQYLRDNKFLEDAGGFGYLPTLPNKVVSALNFPDYLADLKLFALRRWTLQKQARLGELAHASELTPEQLRTEFSEIFEQASKIGTTQKLLDVISPAEAMDYEPDPDDFLIGDGLVLRGQVVTLGGEPGVGKSRLATSLAVAGARGNNRWQNYPVRSQWRTLILQTENSGNRLKEEFSSVPKQFNDFIRVSRSLPSGMAFGNADFRAELLRLYDKWPFQMLVVDPWNDVSSDDGQSDYTEALQNIRRAFFGRLMPCLVIVAHLRKPRNENGQRRKGGRELLHELSGSLALGSTSRTVFVVQAGSTSMDDDRIVFEVAKANDCKPEWLREYGTRTAWHRKSGTFEACPDFDWSQWDNPGDESRRAVTEEMLTQVLDGEEMKAAAIAKRIKEVFGTGESTVFKAISEDGYLRHRLVRTGTGKLKLKT